MKTLKILSFVIWSALISYNAATGTSPIHTSLFGNKAIDGYDPVSYLTEGKAIKGEKKFTTEWNGAVWQFTSAENLARFNEAPEQYAPQYGGYCAWAVVKNQLYKVDPQIFVIENGKTFLFYNEGTRDSWLENIDQHIVTGDRNFPKLVK